MILKSAATLARKIAIRDEIPAELAIQLALDELTELENIDSTEESEIRDSVRANLSGFGQLQSYIDDPSIEEIWVNAPDCIYIAKNGVSSRVETSIPQAQLQVIIERMLRSTGRRLDRSSPFVDASLEDGSRLHVVIPDITRDAWAINIRKFPAKITSLQDLTAIGSITLPQKAILVEALHAGRNILISGATQAGKTTLLCALLNEISDQQRIISVEETFEIRVTKSDWVAMQTRQPNLEGIGEVTLRRLIKEALRMRPDRIVVGEVREAESLDLLIALNSGLPGLCTIHANSATEAVRKLCTLPLLAGQNISSDFVDPTVGTCVDIVVHCQLSESGSRKISEISAVRWNAGAKIVEVDSIQ
jgi:pilus assembly protein CpaF